MKSFGPCVVLAALLLVAPSANADSIVFYLDENNIGLTGGPWATITLSDTTSPTGLDGVRFVIDPLESAFAGAGTNFGLQTFYFNESTTFGSSLTLGDFVPTSWTWTYSAPGKSNAGGGYGKFEFLANGHGDSRANPLSFSVWAPSGESLTIADFYGALSSEGYIFAGHIAGFTEGRYTSAKFATDHVPSQVPEPASLLLLGAGLLGAGFLRRRK